MTTPSSPSLTSGDHQKVLIVDFGSQVTQLIARRLREASVYCEIHPFQKAEAALQAMKPAAIILSGGPESVHEEGSPRAPQGVFEAGVPVLGICYGEMTMCEQLGGKVEGGHTREFGRAEITVEKTSPLLADLAPVGEEETVWMSHGDKIVAIPRASTSSPPRPVRPMPSSPTRPAASTASSSTPR
jgi:GMP synthase (glutamine-hydrolysing)